MPNRIIKESICASDTIDGLSWFEEVLFYRLMVNVDDYGRFDARTAILKARLFPLKSSVTEKQIEQAIVRMNETGILITYTVSGKPYLQLSTWAKHQSIRNKRSKYPSADERDDEPLESNCIQLKSTASKCPRNPIQSESESESESKSNPILFDAFWSAYPKHAAKADAQKAFKALNPDDELMQTILIAIETWKKTDDWTKDGGKFVPLPATYIRGKRWEDELPKSTVRPSKEVGAHRYDQRTYTESQLEAGTSDLVEEALRARNG